MKGPSNEKRIRCRSSSLRLYRTVGGVTTSYEILSAVTLQCNRKVEEFNIHLEPRSWDFKTSLGTPGIEQTGRVEIR